MPIAPGSYWLDFTHTADPHTWDAQGGGKHVSGCSLYLQSGRSSTALAHAILDAGKDFTCNYEFETNGMAQGAAYGVQAAKWSMDYADRILGYRHGGTIWESCDFDAQQADISAVRDCLAAFRDTLESAKAYFGDMYGGANQIDAMGALCVEPWQTLAWSYGKLHPKAVLYQNGRTWPFPEGTADENVTRGVGPNSHLNIIRTFNSPVPVVPPGPVPAPPGGTMPTDDQVTHDLLDAAIVRSGDQDPRAANTPTSVRLETSYAGANFWRLMTDADTINEKLDAVMSKLGVTLPPKK